jgi:hypothetical protein
MSSNAVEFRRKKGPQSEDCRFIYNLRKSRPTLAALVELARKTVDTESLFHLLTCDDCRGYVQERDPETTEAEKVLALLEAVKAIGEEADRRRIIKKSRISRNLARANAR